MIDHSVKSITQTHHGIVYRSRTEARWAEYFRLSHTEFHYEPEGYVLDGGDAYVPDFYLPYSKIFFEIKHGTPNEREVRVAEKLSQAVQAPVVIAQGNPWHGVVLTGIRPGIGWCRLYLFADDRPTSAAWLVSAMSSNVPRWSIKLGPLTLAKPSQTDPRLRTAGKLQFQHRGASSLLGNNLRDNIQRTRRNRDPRIIAGKDW
jgi:hypothetical protein